MDYTQSSDAVVHQSTNHKLHVDNVPVPTVFSAKDANSLIWSLANLCEKAGVPLAQFDADDPDSYDKVYQAVQKIAQTSKFFKNTDALPTSNIGVIWHDLYNGWMTWQEFNQNGANYAGYASVDIGQVRLESEASPRAGWLKTGITNLSKTTYAALWAWAQHHNIVDSLANWTAGTFRFKDNNDGTFALPDLRAEFLRTADDGRGIDSGRVIGSEQEDAIRNITGAFSRVGFNSYINTPNSPWGAGRGVFGNNAQGADIGWQSNQMTYHATFARPCVTEFDASRVVPTAAENRPRNTALLGTIKF